MKIKSMLVVSKALSVIVICLVGLAARIHADEKEYSFTKGSVHEAIYQKYLQHKQNPEHKDHTFHRYVREHKPEIQQMHRDFIKKRIEDFRKTS